MRTLIMPVLLVCMAGAGCKPIDDDPPTGGTSSVDLRPDSPTASPSSPTTTDAIILFVVVHNDGTAISPSCSYSVNRDGTPNFRTGTIPAIAGGSSTTVSIGLGGEPLGAHTYAFTADSANAVGESSEINNTSSLTVTVQSPGGSAADLDPDSPTSSVSSPTTCDAITLSVTVRNVGGTGASSCSYDLARNGITGFRTGTIPSIGAGSSTIISIGLGGEPAGTHTYVFTADSGDTISEGNESNNTSSLSFTVSSGSDLDPDAPTASPASPTVADAVTLSIVVRNRGDGATPSCDYNLARNGVSGFRTGSIPSIAGCGSTTVSIGLGGEPQGTHTYCFTADSGSSVAELSEGNNQACLTLTVAP